MVFRNLHNQRDFVHIQNKIRDPLHRVVYHVPCMCRYALIADNKYSHIKKIDRYDITQFMWQKFWIVVKRCKFNNEFIS